MKLNRSIALFLLAIFFIPAGLFAVYVLYEKRVQSLPLYPAAVNGSKAEGNLAIPDFTLIDQNGEKWGSAEWKDKIVVADFFFASCPVVCPKMTNNVQLVQREFGDEEIVFVSFSIDPVRDDPKRLMQFAERYQLDLSNWHLLTGDKREIYRLARNGFRLVAADGDGGPDDFIHSEKLVLIDRERRVRGYYSGTDDGEVKKLITDIIKLQHEYE
jgi:protein SCO1